MVKTNVGVIGDERRFAAGASDGAQNFAGAKEWRGRLTMADCKLSSNFLRMVFSVATTTRWTGYLHLNAGRCGWKALATGRKK